MWSRFQSTHPARGATQRQSTNGKEQYISIHAPREGCDSTGMAFLEGELEFQSRHPARGATLFSEVTGAKSLFQSTHPARGATGDLVFFNFSANISIHALREGCDVRGNCTVKCRRDFNPRTPRGVRPKTGRNVVVEAIFQSTHPARGATANFTKEQGVCLAQFAYLHKGKKAEHTKTNAPMLH